MPTPLVECVPNFSEGRDRRVIDRIAATIAAVDGVTLLDVDPGRSTNRTVMTFVGAPDAVVEAAVRAGRSAADLIDMRTHHGEHPRFGAMDVCPFVPISGMDLDGVAELAKEAGRRLGDEEGLTVFLYEHAASAPHRRNLADVRDGEYEGLERRLGDPAWQPDFGPAVFNARSGATAVGARGFLIAFNVNLNTTSTRRANAVAFDVRERGRMQRIGHPLTGEIAHDPDGEPIWIPGDLPGVKAIGWYLEEHGIAQVSMNLADLDATPLHRAFDAVVARAAERGMRVTGSELVGLVPLGVMLDAGRHYLAKQQRSLGLPDHEIVRIAVRSLGLGDLAPFDPHDKIIEWRIGGDGHNRLIDRTLAGFVHATASEAPAPGGGSVAATAGALGAALATMVANLSAHARGWDERWSEFSEWAVRGTELHERLLELVDADTEAFDGLMAAYRTSPAAAEGAGRDRAVQAALRRAIEVPLAVMEASVEAMDVLAAMAEIGLPSSVSDAGVGALLARAGVLGAGLNVRINTGGLTDQTERSTYLARADEFERTALRREPEILETVRRRIG